MYRISLFKNIAKQFSRIYATLKIFNFYTATRYRPLKQTLILLMNVWD